MWNEITQANYDRSDQRYASNLSDGEPESPSTVKYATIFGQLGVLSGESRISEADATNLTLNKIDEFLRLLRRFNAFSAFDTYPATEKMGNKVL